MARADLVEKLKDEPSALRQTQAAEAFPRAAAEYLDDWAGDEDPPGSDDPHFDLPPPPKRRWRGWWA